MAQQTPRFQFSRQTRPVKNLLEGRMSFPLIAKVISVADAYQQSCPTLTPNALLWIRSVENQQRVVLRSSDGKFCLTVPLNTTDKYSIVYRGGNSGIPQLLRDIMKVRIQQETVVTQAENPDMCFSSRPGLTDSTSYGPLKIIGITTEACLTCQLISDRLELSTTQMLISKNVPLTLDIAEGLHMNTPQEFNKCVEYLKTQSCGEASSNDMRLLSAVPDTEEDATHTGHACQLYQAMAKTNTPRDQRIQQSIKKGDILKQSNKEDTTINCQTKQISSRIPPMTMSKSHAEQTEPVLESVYDLKKAFNVPCEQKSNFKTPHFSVDSKGRSAFIPKPLPPPPLPPFEPVGEIYENMDDVFQDTKAINHISSVQSYRMPEGDPMSASVKEISKKLDSIPMSDHQESTRQTSRLPASGSRSLQKSGTGSFEYPVSGSINVNRNNSATSFDSYNSDNKVPVSPVSRNKMLMRQNSTPANMWTTPSDGHNLSAIAAPYSQSTNTKNVQKGDGYVKMSPPIPTNGAYEDVEDWGIIPKANGSPSPITSVATLSNQRSAWNKLDDVPLDITSFSVEDITKVLQLLKMDKYSKKLAKNDVDGALLMTLEEVHLVKDFKMSAFNANKLVQFKRGWRPVVQK